MLIREVQWHKGQLKEARRKDKNKRVLGSCSPSQTIDSNLNTASSAEQWLHQQVETVTLRIMELHMSACKQHVLEKLGMRLYLNICCSRNLKVNPVPNENHTFPICYFFFHTHKNTCLLSQIWENWWLVGEGGHSWWDYETHLITKSDLQERQSSPVTMGDLCQDPAETQGPKCSFI